MSKAESVVVRPPYIPFGKYFEDFKVGDRLLTPSRTMTETDIVSFAWITADWNPPHTDAVVAEKTFFGRRVLHGPLICSASLGLVYRTGILEGTSLAFLDWHWRFLAPVFIGDTLTVLSEVTEVRPSKSKTDRGAVTFNIKTLNQDDVVVGEGAWTIMMARRQIG